MMELKKRTSIAEQIELMEKRGLIIRDHSIVAEALRNLNYYRISGYLHDFKKPGADEYEDGLTWDAYRHYMTLTGVLPAYSCLRLNLLRKPSRLV